MSHTKEPWAIFEDDKRAIVTVENPNLSLLSIDEDGLGIFFSEEDARRAVACVNACSGSSTEWLEFSVSEDCAELSGPFEPLETRITRILRTALSYMVERDQIRKQRDELLVVLEQAARALESGVQYSQDCYDEPPYPSSKWDYEAYQLSGEIDAAIANAKGSAS